MGDVTGGQVPRIGCTVTGTAGNDRLVGTVGDDYICGQGGDDTLIGLGGDDVLIGGPGRDRLVGGAGKDSLFGDTGDDDLVGGDEVDQLLGGDGDDDLRGGSGDDVLVGGNGDDSVHGGPGTDNVGSGGDDVWAMNLRLHNVTDVDMTLSLADGADCTNPGMTYPVNVGSGGKDGVSVQLQFNMVLGTSHCRSSTPSFHLAYEAAGFGHGNIWFVLTGELDGWPGLFRFTCDGPFFCDTSVDRWGRQSYFIWRKY